MERRERRIVWGIIAGFVGVAMLMVGVCAFVVVRAIRGQGVSFPGRELVEYRERYGDIKEKTNAIVDARRNAQEESLAAARAVVPAGAPIPADWDLGKALKKGWLPVEQKTLAGLASAVSPAFEGDPSRDETIEDLKELLGVAGQAGKITRLEARFDPNQHGADGVFDHFREFVLTAGFLDELEAAIDLGLCRSTWDWETAAIDLGNCRSIWDWEPEDEGRQRLAARLLACRAYFLAEGAAQEEALETCLRLYKWADILSREVSEDWWAGDHWYQLADRALMFCLRSGPVPDEWRARLLTWAERRCDRELLCAKLRVHAVSGVSMEEEKELDIVLSGSGLGAYRAYEQAEALIGLLEQPLYESAGKLGAIEDKFGLGRLRGEEEDSPSAVEVVASALDLVTGGVDVINERSAIEHLVHEFRHYARASMMPEVLRTAFALADCRAENGRYPKSLSELVPGTLESAPLDAMTGTPIVYEVDEKGYVLKAAAKFCPYAEEPETLWRDSESP